MDNMTKDVIEESRSAMVAIVLQICCGWFGILGSLGYFYIGQWQKALVIIAIFIAMLPLTILTGGLAYPFGWILWVVTVIDVFMQARVLEGGKPIRQWTFFSQQA